MKAKARWEQIAQTSNGVGFSLAGGGSHAIQSPPMQWVAVDDDDEILAFVTGGGMLWTAHISYTGTLGHSHSQGTFLSEDAGKRRVEKWLAATHDFQRPANWVYSVSP